MWRIFQNDIHLWSFSLFRLEETVVLKITAKDYLGKLAGDGSIKLYVKAKVDETNQSYAKQDTVEMIKPAITVTVGNERTTNVTWSWNIFLSQITASERQIAAFWTECSQNWGHNGAVVQSTESTEKHCRKEWRVLRFQQTLNVGLLHSLGHNA